MEDAKWYVIHTYSGYENKVAQNIEKLVENRSFNDLITDVRVPTEKVSEPKGSEIVEVERKVFPSYVLVKMVMTDDTWYLVRNVRGVTGFVGTAAKPIPLSQHEVEAIGVEQKSIKVSYAIGDSVKIIQGPLEGFIGLVEELDLEGDRVKVMVSMFGRETPVELKLNQALSAEV